MVKFTLKGISNLTESPAYFQQVNGIYRKDGALALDEVKLLTKETAQEVLTTSKILEFVKALDALYGKGFLTKENIRGLSASEHPEKASSTLIYLGEAGLLTIENREFVLAHRASDRLFSAVCTLRYEGLLEENFTFLRGCCLYIM